MEVPRVTSSKSAKKDTHARIPKSSQLMATVKKIFKLAITEAVRVRLESKEVLNSHSNRERNRVYLACLKKLLVSASKTCHTILIHPKGQVLPP